ASAGVSVLSASAWISPPMRSPSVAYTMRWRASGSLPAKASQTTVASKCTPSSPCTCAVAPGRPCSIRVWMVWGFTDGSLTGDGAARDCPYTSQSAYRKAPARNMAHPATALPTHDSAALATSGRRVFQLEAEALAAGGNRLDGDFSQACRLMLAARGRVVCTGMGKSGHVARKIAATMASTGTPAFYVHPGEAGHGDLGMITDADVVLALSYSGESDEVLMLLPVLKRQGNPLITMTGRPASSLARAADVHLDVSVPAEACPIDLAPTSSTTASLAMGDALAVALMEARGFTADDFARSHPAGALGRKLLLHIADVMHGGDDVPRVGADATVSEALVEMSHKRLGMTA